MSGIEHRRGGQIIDPTSRSYSHARWMTTQEFRTRREFTLTGSSYLWRFAVGLEFAMLCKVSSGVEREVVGANSWAATSLLTG